ncbi:hypothetical protein [uncultured Halomonas sp.]|uniref:hypothetical protein n=1 Tax=uncultured Halomonas sp. TaxID=173971 RepID=UPI00262CE842|nr:hypothetical protein [uncultured Halomonas sp.]
MGYSSDETMVRVDFFKPDGKWCATEAVKWTGSYFSKSSEEAFKKSLRDHLNKRFAGMTAACLEPFHIQTQPMMLKDGAWNPAI